MVDSKAKDIISDSLYDLSRIRYYLNLIVQNTKDKNIELAVNKIDIAINSLKLTNQSN